METTSLVPESPRDEGYRSSQTEDSFLDRAVSRARTSSCPNCQGFYLVSRGTGRAFEMSCKAWSCPVCSRRRRAVAVEVIAGGLARARSRRERVRFLTLTAPSDGLSLRALYASWNRLRTTLRKSGELAEYAAVVELGSPNRPEPHLHVLATGRYIPQARLSTLAESAGFGRVVDIREVKTNGEHEAVAYVSKRMAKHLVGYLVKAETESLAGRAAAESGSKRVQVRPLRLSKRWYPGGFKAAEKAVAERMAAKLDRDPEPGDPGPWFMVAKRWDGDLSVISRPKRRESAADAEARGACGSEATRASRRAGASGSAEAVRT